MSSTSTPAVTTTDAVQFLGQDALIANADGTVGFFGVTPTAQTAVIAAATDAASAITQLNLVIAALKDRGLVATA